MKAVYGILAATILFSCQAQEEKKPTQAVETEVKEQVMSNKEIVLKGMDAFFKDYDEKGVRKYYQETYIQHNRHVPTGIEPVIGFLPALKDAGTIYENHRILVDGDLVVMHNTFDNAEAFGAKEVVTFDVFRVEDGKIAEHWDAITPVVTETASGRSQVDGPSEVKDLDKTEANKQLISSFLEDVMFGKNSGKITEYISSEQYHQHNTAVKDGLDGLNEAIAYLSSTNNMFVYKKIHKVIGEGNFVLSMCEGEWNGKNQAFYDLFRIENNQIVEHWDVIHEIPTELAHDNGVF